MALIAFLNVQAEGFKTKYKSLEEILKMNRKMEAKLIGYDEKPTYFANVKVEDHLSNRFSDLKVHPISVDPMKNCSPSMGPTTPPPSTCQLPRHQLTKTVKNNSPNVDSEAAGNKIFVKCLLII